MKPAPAAPQPVRLAVKLSPKASRNAVLGWHGDLLKMSVTAAPERGRANAAAAALLAETLGLPKSAVQLERGATSHQKLFVVAGLGAAEVRRRLDLAMPQGR